MQILSLDGGGAKGVYTLGVLKEVEALVGQPLYKQFGLVYGTSTGAIIAALIGLEKSVDDILRLYLEYVPRVMSRNCKEQKSAALRELATHIFGDQRFDSFKTRVGIVATNWDLEKPMIFKNTVQQAHGMTSTFKPGFGCTIAEAVQASCSAYPFFKRQRLKTENQGDVEAADGGYCANNPTLYAVADATVALKVNKADLRVLSVGVGSYPEPAYGLKDRLIRRLESVRLLQKTLNVNTASMDQLRRVLYPDVRVVRISEAFDRPELATDLLESDPKKLNMLYQRGRESFAKFEKEIKELVV